MNIVELAKMRKLFGGSGGSGGGNFDALVDGSSTEVTSYAEKVSPNLFSGNKKITSVNFPKATFLEMGAFQDSTALVTVNCPLVTKVDSEAFYGCAKLTNVNFPEATYIGDYAFTNCPLLVNVNFPKVTRIKSRAFAYAYKIMKYDFPKLTDLSTYAFRANRSLTRLILRSETMCTLIDINTFDSCYHFHGTVDSTYNPDGLKDGYIYVPRALIEDYKVATNWTTYATQFRALEDYTVDGTTTGELDESKVNA